MNEEYCMLIYIRKNFLSRPYEVIPIVRGATNAAAGILFPILQSTVWKAYEETGEGPLMGYQYSMSAMKGKAEEVGLFNLVKRRLSGDVVM